MEKMEKMGKKSKKSKKPKKSKKSKKSPNYLLRPIYAHPSFIQGPVNFFTGLFRLFSKLRDLVQCTLVHLYRRTFTELRSTWIESELISDHFLYVSITGRGITDTPTPSPCQCSTLYQTCTAFDGNSKNFL